MHLTHWIRAMLIKRGFDIKRCDPHGFPRDFQFEPQTVLGTLHKVKAYTMTSPERLFALCQAVAYVVQNNIPGDMVECGVWRGGSMMAVADTLLRLGDTSRHLYLFDTFQGMTQPTEKDQSILGHSALSSWHRNKVTNDQNTWCYSALEDVRQAMQSTGYNEKKVHYIQGNVEDTVPEGAPEQIAFLRLDTDWYESTKHELIHLYPRLVPGGVLILDDYGHWQGARQATDEYLAENNLHLLLTRIDGFGRLAIKPVVSSEMSIPANVIRKSVSHPA